MMENKIMNDIEDGYDGRAEVIYSTKVVVDHENPQMFNGFKAEFDLYEGLSNEKKLIQRTAIPEVKYNYPDESLYVVVQWHFAKALTEEEIEKLTEYCKASLAGNVIIAKLGETEYKISLDAFDNTYAKQRPLEAPEGFMYLDDLFKDQKDGAGYYEFLNHKLSFERLKKLCIKLGDDYKLKDDMVTGMMLPIHRKHEATGAMLVHKDVQHQYEMFKMAQNYLRGFDEGTNEYALGVAMAHDIKFNDYVLRTAKRQEDGKEPDPDNFTSEFNRAIKRIDKKEYLK